ncbi:LexA family protein [Acinetobacter soli]|uniref:LexA family protein n=1 Tax=Acinetobacter soli TaxID=487316 RepID=UPI000468BB91|nr:LexA family transcriptional regulator [Acinetobacter soli]
MSTLRERLKQSRLSNNKTQAEVAEAVGMSQPAYQALESGKNQKSSFLPMIANFLNVDIFWLQTGVEQKKPQHMNFVPPVDLTHSENPRQTPVLSWVQAGDFSYVLSSDLSSAVDWIPYDPRAGKSGFALIVKGTSMEPDFKPDEFIYINPTYQIDELNTGALVVMACEGDSEATFKKLISEDGNYYLQPLNPNWKPQLIPLDHTCRLVGKVVGKYTRY